MPIEHEHKFILRPSLTLFNTLGERGFASPITQFYVSDAARYREVLPPGSSLGGGSLFGAQWLFTHKLAVGQDVLEHEMDVSRDDFLLAQKASIGTLWKKRYTVEGRAEKWDIDFFYDAPHGFGELIFSMAECEHQRGAQYDVLPEIAGSVIYAVPEREAKEFSNRRLTSLAYIRALRERFKL